MATMRHVHHRTDLDLAVDGHRAVLRLVQSQDGHLRVVDDRRADQRAEHPAVGDGEGAAGQVLHGELAVAGALAEVGDLLLDVGESQLLGVTDDGDD